MIVDRVEDRELQGLVVVFTHQDGGHPLSEQLLGECAGGDMVADVLRLSNESLNAAQVAVHQKHLGAEGDGDPLVAVLKTVEFAGAVKKVGELGVECRIVEVVLNVIQDGFEFLKLQGVVGSATALLDREAVSRHGLLQRDVDDRHLTPVPSDVSLRPWLPQGGLKAPCFSLRDIARIRRVAVG